MCTHPPGEAPAQVYRRMHNATPVVVLESMPVHQGCQENGAGSSSSKIVLAALQGLQGCMILPA